MKKFEINKSKLYALLLAGGMATSFTACNQEKQNDNQEPINSDNNTEITEIEETTKTTVTTIESIKSAIVTSEGKVELEEKGAEEIVSETSVPANRVNIDGDDAHNVYVESANEVNIYYGTDEYCDTDVNLVTENVEHTETTKATQVQTTAQTTVAPVQTTAQTTTTPVQTTVTTSQVQEYAYKDIDLARFEELTQNLVDEFNRVGLVKAKGKNYTKADLYSTVYSYNCDYIDEDLKQQLIDKNYISDDVASVLVDAASPRDAIMTDTETKAILNTNIDEIYFGLNYFKDDEDVFYQMFDDEAQYDIYDYNSTNKVRNRITEKLKTLDIDEYYEARNHYYGNLKKEINMPVCKFIANSDNAPKEFIGRNSYQLEDFVDISVAINDPEAKKNVQQTLKLIVDASLDNSKAVNSLNSFSNFYMGDKQHTTLTDCGAGATFAMNTYIYAYSDFLAKNPYKNLQGFAKDEEQYKQMKLRYDRIANDSQELNDVVRIFDSCSRQLTK